MLSMLSGSQHGHPLCRTPLLECRAAGRLSSLDFRDIGFFFFELFESIDVVVAELNGLDSVDVVAVVDRDVVVTAGGGGGGGMMPVLATAGLELELTRSLLGRIVTIVDPGGAVTVDVLVIIEFVDS